MNAKDNYIIRFAYNKLAYFGRYGLSMKAINIEFVEFVGPSQINMGPGLVMNIGTLSMMQPMGMMGMNMGAGQPMY